MNTSVKITGIIVGIILITLVVPLSNFSNTDFQTAEAEKTKENFFDEYKKWATSEIKKFKTYAAKLKSQLTQYEKINQELQTEIKYLKNDNEDLTEQIIYYQNELASYVQYEADVKEWAKQIESEYENKVDSMTQAIQEYEEEQKIEKSKPISYVKNLKMNWEFNDSKGNRYAWGIPIETYENLIKSPEPQDLLYLKLSEEETITARDHTKFIKKSFTNVIDDLYENAGSDELFVYEVWHLISQLTIYSEDIGEDPRWALETLSRGGGDCEDTAILMADLLRSSSHTKDWKIQMVYFDSDNPTNPRSMNHVVIYIDTGEISGKLETTAKTSDGLNKWNGQQVVGWSYDV